MVSYDNCAVPISPSHPPAPSIAALEGAGEHFECVCVCVWVCVCVGVCVGVGVGVGVGVCGYVHVRDVCGNSFGLAPILCCCTACGCTI